MSRFSPPSAEELAARGLGPDGNPLKTTKVRARNSDGTLKQMIRTLLKTRRGKKYLLKSVVALRKRVSYV